MPDSRSSSSPPPGSRPGRAFHVSGGSGCLLSLLALPVALFALVVALVRGLLVRRAPRPEVVPASPAEAALASLVRKMALDATFTLDDARMAGLPADAGAGVEDLLEIGVRRGWIVREGAEFAVTDDGRRAAQAYEQRYGLD